MIQAFASASSKRRQALEKKKTEENQQKFKQQKISEELKILNLKKLQTLEAAKEDAKRIDLEIAQLKKLAKK